MPDPRVAALLEPATHRLVRTVDQMSDEEWAAPSLLPDWTRAHLVAHLTLAGEGLSGALEGVHEGRSTPMYESDEARDAAIAALAGESVGDIRTRFLASTTVLAEWVEDLADNLEPVIIERTPGGRSFPAGTVGEFRLREVEVHHVDLGLDYSTSDWPGDFVDLLLEGRAAAYRGDAGFIARASDADRAWTFGSSAEGGATVSGPAVALAWWSTGRGTGAGLTSDNGELPKIGAW